MTSGPTTTTGRPGAAAPRRPARPGFPGSMLRPVLAAVVVALLAGGTVTALTRGPASAEPAGPATEPATSAPLVVTPPSGWVQSGPQATPLEVFGVPFTRLAEAPPFAAGQCPQPAPARGVAATALVAVPAGTTVEQAAQAFARGTAEAAYAGAVPQVSVGAPAPRPTTPGTPAEPGTWLTAAVHTDGTVAGVAGCRATDATIGVLAVPRTAARDGSTGVAMLVVAADAGGGPGDVVPRTDLTDLAGSALAPR